MKKNIIIFAIIMIASMAANAQFVNVKPQLVPGTISGDVSPGCNGTSVTLTCTPTTGGYESYTYEWQVSTDGINFNNIIGENTLMYTTPALSDTANYRLQITDMCGIIYSDTATMNIYDPFVFVTDNLITGGNNDICYNTSGGIMTAPTVVGGAPGTTYQWQSSTDGITFTNILGATNNVYTAPNLMTTNYYQAIITNTCGVLTSAVKTVNVYADFAFVTDNLITGGNDNICYNTSGGIMTAPTIVGGAPGTTYQWQSSTDGITFTNILGATNNIYTAPNLMTTNYYQAIITNTCGVLTSAVKTVNVYADFVFVTDNLITGGNSPICNGELGGTMTTPAFVGGAPGTTIQWQLSTDDIIFNDIIGETNATYVAGNLTDMSYYKTIATNTCGTLTSSVKTITVYAPFDPGMVTNDTVNICYGTQPPAFINLTLPSGGDGNYVYQWIESSTNTAPWNPATGTNNQMDYQPPTLYSPMGYRRQVTNMCGSGNSGAQ